MGAYPFKMERTSLANHMNLPLEARQTHLNLSESCLEIGGCSKSNRALLAMHLNTTCETLGMKTGYLCHACHNGKCSNVNHLYWGSAKENSQDKLRDQPKLGMKIKQNIVERYGEDHYRKAGALGHLGWKSGKPAQTLTSEQVNQRIHALLDSGIDIQTYGWVNKTATLWGISHSQVRRFFQTYWTGPAPYEKKKKSPSK